MQLTCHCGQVFEAKRATAKYCSPRCRQRAFKGAVKIREVPEGKPDIAPVGRVVEQVSRELHESGQFETALGAQCLALAARMDNPRMDTGSAIAAVSKQLTILMAEATRGFKASSMQRLRDELAERRRAHGA